MSDPDKHPFEIVVQAMRGKVAALPNTDPFAVCTPQTAKALRLHAGWTQAQAAAAAHYGAAVRWSEIETGARNMDAARWELMRIKAGVHPQYRQDP